MATNEPTDTISDGAGRPGWGAEQSRTITWHDPAASIEACASLSGLDYLTAMLEGRLPASPIGTLVGIQPVSATTGDVVFRAVADPSFTNPVGLIHGGFLCTLLDAAAASAVHTTLPAGAFYSTIEIKVSFLRPVRAGDELLAHGWVTKPGSQIAFAEADAKDNAGRTVATATTSCLIKRP
jgi:uncharacterized protein (TIGR00369 family)